MPSSTPSTDNAPAVDTRPVSGIGARLAGKFMTFMLADEEYGLEILKVREIIGLMNITRVPRVADFVRGVINLRGRVIPVIELRSAFGMDRVEATDQTVIIVVQCHSEDGDVTMGVIVDEVLEVVDLRAEQIEPTPTLSSASSMDFLLGVAKVDGRVVYLLEIDKVLSPDERTGLSSLA